MTVFLGRPVTETRRTLMPPGLILSWASLVSHNKYLSVLIIDGD